MRTVQQLRERHEREMKEAMLGEAVSGMCLEAGLPLPMFAIFNRLYGSEGSCGSRSKARRQSKS